MELLISLSSPFIKTCLFLFGIGFLPGWLLCRLLTIKSHTLIWSHAFSVLLFSASLWLSAQSTTPLSYLQPALLFGLSLLILFLLFTKLNIKNILHPTQKRPSLIPLLTISLAVATYLSIIGTYDLVPSDILRHMERIQAAARDVADVTHSEFVFFNGISDHYHYYFYAYLMQFSRLNIHAVLWISSALNSTLILLVLYQFALYQGIGQVNRPNQTSNTAIVFAILSLILFILTKGIAGFSFIRYYSLAPTLLSFSVFLIIIIRIDYCLRQQCTKQDILSIFLGMVMLLFWHLQELLFTLTFSALLVFYYYAHSKLIPTSKALSIAQRPWLLMSTVLIIVIMIAILIILWQFEAPSGMTNRLVTLEGLLRLFVPSTVELPTFTSGIKILNPFIQFSQVLGLWGVLVYLCAFFHLKLLAKKPLLLCGLLIPLITVFNPLFVDVFLRLRGEDTLYRLLYAIPLSTVGALLIVHSVCILYESISQTTTLNQSNSQKIIALLSISALIIGLLPFKSTTLLTQYNRLNDILPIDHSQSLLHWHDLSNELRNLPAQSNILTDPITGYIITATTKSIARRYKFTRSQHFDLNTLNFDSNHEEPFSAYKGRYLIINLRDGATSQLGLLSTHWPKNILKVSTYYSTKLLDYISKNPKHFNHIWQHNKITIYRIK